MPAPFCNQHGSLFNSFIDSSSPASFHAYSCQVIAAREQCGQGRLVGVLWSGNLGLYKLA